MDSWDALVELRVQRVRFIVTLKLIKSLHFRSFLISVVLLCEKLTKPCCHAKNAHLISQQSLASIINKTQNVNKTYAFSHNCPLRHRVPFLGLYHTGVRMHACTSACVCASVNANVSACMHVCVHVCACMHVCMHLCACVFLHACNVT